MECEQATHLLLETVTGVGAYPGANNPYTLVYRLVRSGNESIIGLLPDNESPTKAKI